MKLTREQRNAIFAGRKVRISGPGECPMKPTDVIELSSRVSIRVENIRRNRRNEWSLEYTIVDFRDLYLLPSSHAVKIDDRGNPLPMSEAEAHGYTANPKRSLDAGIAVGAAYQHVVSLEARAKRAEERRREKAKEETDEDLRRVNAELRELAKRAAKMGIDPMVALAPVAREIQIQHASLKDAA